MRLKTLPLSRIKKGQRVLLRIDGNFPVDKKGRLQQGASWRLEHVLPYVEQLSARGAVVVLSSHQRGEGVQASLVCVATWLKKHSRLKITMAPDTIGDAVKGVVEAACDGEVVVLENPRLYEGEKKNTVGFAKALAELADVYVNNAFGTSHRKHASVHAVTKYLPSFAGPDVVKEVRVLSAKHKQDMCLVMGGIKLKTKLPVIEHLGKEAQAVLTGGGIAVTLLAARDRRSLMLAGKPIAKEELALARKALKLHGEKIVLPVDFVVDRRGKKTVWADEVLETDRIVDIGKRTQALYRQYVMDAKEVVWNGTMGIVEERGAAKGTLEVAKAVREMNGKSVVGGGDTLGFLHKKNMKEGFTHLSTGGGAMLVFLAGGAMPGLDVLTQ